jgi:hypothetical protein
VNAGVARPMLASEPAWTRSLATSRASDRALAGFGALCLKGFLVAQFLSLTRLFFSNHLGDGVTSYASEAGLLSVALLAPAVLTYGLQSGSPFGTLVPAARSYRDTKPPRSPTTSFPTS